MTLGCGGGAFTVALEDFKFYFYIHVSIKKCFINKTKLLHFQTKNYIRIINYTHYI